MVSSLGLRLAFAEWRPAHVPRDEREAILAAVDRYENFLREVAERAVGFALAWLGTKQFGEFPEDFDAQVGDIEFPFSILSPVQSAPQLAIGSAATPGAAVEEAMSSQTAWGSRLVKLHLNQYKASLNALIKAGIGEGLAREQIRQLLMQKLAPNVPNGLLPEWRARLIAQTEVIRSYNATARARYTDLGETHLKWLDGQLGACPSCAALHGTIIPMEHEGVSAYYHDQLRGFVVKHPPLHPGCRCTVIAATEEEYLEQPDFDKKTFSPDPDVSLGIGGIGGKDSHPILLPKPTPPAPAKPITDALKKLMDKGMSPDDAFYELQNNKAKYGLDVVNFEALGLEHGIDYYKPGVGSAEILGVVMGDPVKPEWKFQSEDVNATILKDTLAGMVSNGMSAQDAWDSMEKLGSIGGKKVSITALADELGISAAHSTTQILHAAIPGQLSVAEEAVKYIRAHFKPGDPFPTGPEAFEDFAKKMDVDPYDVMQALKATGKSWAQHVSEAIAPKAKASLVDTLQKKAPSIPAAPALVVEHQGSAFPPPAATEKFINWYQKSGEGKTGVSVFHAYSKVTGKNMNAIKKEIEAEGYAVPALIKLKPGEALPPPAAVKPKPLSKAQKAKLGGAEAPPGTAKVTVAKPDPTFKNEAKLYPAEPEGGFPPKYWEETKQTGGQMGSNKGGVFTGPDGQQWYMKQYTRSPLQAQAESFTHMVEDLLGIGRPLSAVVKMGGEEWYATKLMPNLRQLSPAEWQKIFKANPGMAEKIHIGASFTANWDVAGKTFDNLLWDDVAKRPVIIDSGGSIKWRAQGGNKSYGSSVLEFDSLMSSSVNKNTAALFGQLYKDEASVNAGLAAAEHLRERVAWLEKQATAAGILTGAETGIIKQRLDDLVAKLKERKADLIPYTPFTGPKPPIFGDTDFAKLQSVGVKTGAPDMRFGGSANPSASLSQGKELASSWSGSAQSEISKTAKAQVSEVFFGVEARQAYINELKRQGLSQYGGFKIEDVRLGSISKDTVKAIYAETQAILRKEHPSGFVTLYRGTGSQANTQQEIKRLIAELKEKGTGVWYPATLSSFSLKQSTGENFGFSGAYKMVIKIRVPIESIFMSTQWMDKNGGYHPNEKEYILMTGPGGLTLTAENVSITANGKKIFSEPEPAYDPDGFVFLITLDDEEEWHDYLYKGATPPADN